MMSNQRPNKLPAVEQDGLWPLLLTAGALFLLLGAWMAAWGAAALAGLGDGGPGEWLLGPGPEGRWSTAATGWLLALLVPLALLSWWVVRGIVRARSGREWTDDMASAMSSRRDLAELLADAVAADTERLGSQGAGIGISLGKAVLTKEWLYGTYEWCQVWIMGPRAGKTRSVAVPQLVEHGGAAVATSNKPDIVYLTRGPRSELGRVDICDPQRIYADGAPFWVNLLRFVTGLERAEQLATVWMDSEHSSAISAEDPFFGPAARTLLTNMVLAAAVGEQPVTRVLEWLQFPNGAPGVPDPIKILRENGYEAAARDVKAVRDMVPETRDGIYGGALAGVKWMRNPEFTRWVTPAEDGSVREFVADDFVRSTGTLYLLSKDGPGSARALIGSLTVVVYEAGRDLAKQHSGRVPTPVLFCLDECANIVRWGELPSLFSYSGSLGLLLVVILQSQEQGTGCWGETGFGQLWSAANVGVVGRGINDEKHLSALSRLIGIRQHRDRSRTVSRGQVSTSTSIRDESIFTEAELRALPRGRAILMVSGARTILLELVDYSKRRDGERIEASKSAFAQPWMTADEHGDATTEGAQA